MALRETGISLHMKQGSMVDSILVPKVLQGEAENIIEAFDKTELMKCKGYTQMFEDDNFTGNFAYALPTPPSTIYRRKIVTFKLTNATDQNVFVKCSLPYNGELTNLDALKNAFITKTLAFGKVEKCTYVIKG